MAVGNSESGKSKKIWTHKNIAIWETARIPVEMKR